MTGVVGALLDWGVLTYDCVEENMDRMERERERESCCFTRRED